MNKIPGRKSSPRSVHDRESPIKRRRSRSPNRRSRSPTRRGFNRDFDRDSRRDDRGGSPYRRRGGDFCRTEFNRRRRSRSFERWNRKDSRDYHKDRDWHYDRRRSPERGRSKDSSRSHGHQSRDERSKRRNSYDRFGRSPSSSGAYRRSRDLSPSRDFFDSHSVKGDTRDTDQGSRKFPGDVPSDGIELPGLGGLRGYDIVELKETPSVQQALEVLRQYNIKGYQVVMKEEIGNKLESQGLPSRDPERLGMPEPPLASYDPPDSYPSSIQVEEPHPPPMDVPVTNSKRVLVDNIDFRATRFKLEEVFRIAGKVVNVLVKHDQQSTCYSATIEYELPFEASRAVSLLHGQMLFNHAISVTIDDDNELPYPEGNLKRDPFLPNDSRERFFIGNEPGGTLAEREFPEPDSEQFNVGGPERGMGDERPFSGRNSPPGFGRGRPDDFDDVRDRPGVMEPMARRRPDQGFPGRGGLDTDDAGHRMTARFATERNLERGPMGGVDHGPFRDNPDLLERNPVRRFVGPDFGPRDMGPRDVGPKDFGPRDMGPRDFDSRDNRPRDIDTRDNGPRDFGPRDNGPRDFSPRDMGVRDGGPRDMGLRDFVPREVGSRDFAPRDMGSRDITPRDFVPRDMEPSDFGSRDVVSRDYGSRDVAPRDFGPRDVDPRDFSPRDMDPRDFGPRDVDPRDFGPREKDPRDVPRGPLGLPVGEGPLRDDVMSRRDQMVRGPVVEAFSDQARFGMDQPEDFGPASDEMKGYINTASGDLRKVVSRSSVSPPPFRDGPGFRDSRRPGFGDFWDDRDEVRMGGRDRLDTKEDFRPRVSEYGNDFPTSVDERQSGRFGQREMEIEDRPRGGFPEARFERGGNFSDDYQAPYGNRGPSQSSPPPISRNVGFQDNLRGSVPDNIADVPPFSSNFNPAFDERSRMDPLVPRGGDSFGQDRPFDGGFEKRRNPARDFFNESFSDNMPANMDRNSTMNQRMPCRIIVKNLPYDFTAKALKECFLDIGELDSVELKPKGMAYVRFCYERDAQRAIDLMNGRFINGRPMYLSFY